MSRMDKFWVIFGIACLTYYLIRVVVMFQFHEFGFSFWISLLNIGLYVYIIRSVNEKVERSIERELEWRARYF